MNRKYTAAEYLNKIELLKKYMPDITISTDVIAGFCGETDKDHNDTLDLMRKAEFYYAFMFKYSVRSGTAASKLKDDVSDAVKSKRLEEIIALQQNLSLASYKNDIGKIFEVLIEGTSKRSKRQMFGRTEQNKVVVFDAENNVPGSYINVEITDCTAATLIGKILK
jgi:tRNA-2-methylthio-N6-dimethylallyladenosine synthase